MECCRQRCVCPLGCGSSVAKGPEPLPAHNVSTMHSTTWSWYCPMFEKANSHLDGSHRGIQYHVREEHFLLAF